MQHVRLSRRSGCFVRLVPLVLLVACSAEVEPTVSARAQEIVYGQDDRVDLYAAPEPFARLARQTAVALLGPSQLQRQSDASYRIEAPLYGEVQGLCKGERFADQPAAVSCSGVLVAPDIVLTAGHCLGFAPNGSPDCKNNRYVLGFAIPEPGATIHIEAADVFDCKRVLARVQTPDAEACHFDFALLQLDRPASVAPAPIGEWPVAQGDDVVVIGFTAGLPVKIDLGAKVIDARSKQGDFFTLSSDTFAVSSGSGVFDSAGKLVGLFSRGRRDYDSDGSCQRVHHEDQTTAPAYEQTTQIAAIRQTLGAIARAESPKATSDAQMCNALDYAELDPNALGRGEASDGSATRASNACASAGIGRQNWHGGGLVSMLVIVLFAIRRRGRSAEGLS